VGRTKGPHIRRPKLGLDEASGIPGGEGHFQDMSQGPREQDFGACTRPEQKDPAAAFVPRACGQGQGLLGLVLAPHELVQLFADTHGPNRRAGRTPAAPLLLEDRLAQLGAFAADVHLARPLDERADVRVALAAERAAALATFHGGSSRDGSSASAERAGSATGSRGRGCEPPTLAVRVTGRPGPPAAMRKSLHPVGSSRHTFRGAES
jgi:hypothetical protein